MDTISPFTPPLPPFADCLAGVGAIFPVAPFLWLQGNAALLVSLVLSGFALALIGAVTSLFTGRNVVFTSLRSLVLGLAAAASTYGVGRLVGVTLS